MERDKNEKQQQQQAGLREASHDTDREEGGIDLSRDEFGHSPIQEESRQPIGGAGRLVTPSDMEAPGGSSSLHAQSQSDALARHRQPGSAHLDHDQTDLSRGEAFDQDQGGGRGQEDVD